ncbi:MAG: UDP-N-acetylmuramoylalanyl-D-glutamyl-2,6-diaminopimelate--D-alanyl-D-alanine ligase [Alphaproteobacteria bacterium]
MANPLWTLGEVLVATGGRSTGDPANAVSGFSIDSRSLDAGEGFIAIHGPNRDAHEFVPAALDAGAACAVVEENYSRSDEQRLVRVIDTFDALNDLGRAGRTRAETAVVIAVTGSVGKTGTKEALRRALVPSGTVHASSKSYNNHWGVPLTLANMPRDFAYGVFEIGMNHAGEIDALTRLVRPHIAIITTVAPVHLGFFSSVEEIADAKAEIFHGLEPGGAAVINRDNTHFERLAAHAAEQGAVIVSFGEDESADARLCAADLRPDGSHVRADILGEMVDYRLRAPGRHLVQNSLAVLAAVKLAGADIAKAAEALGVVQPEAGRGERRVIETKAGLVAIVDESYNANPASLRAALSTLSLVPRNAYKRRVAVLGDMLELGAEGPKLHAALAEAIDEAGVDVVFACGELMEALFEVLPAQRRGAYAPSSEALAPKLLEGVRPGDIIMIKGSLGSRMAPLVEAVARHFEAESITA